MTSNVCDTVQFYLFSSVKYILHYFRRKIAFLYLNVNFKRLFTKNQSDPIFSGTLPIRSNFIEDHTDPTHFFGESTDPIQFFRRVHQSDPNFFSMCLLLLLASMLISTSDSLQLVKQIPDQIGTKNYRQVIKMYHFFPTFKLTRKLLVSCRKKIS
jgi:hypothetical protein